MIRPIVNLSKIIDDFDVVVLGLYGTIFDGQTIDKESQTLIFELYKAGKKVVVISNTSKRVVEVCNILKENGINLKWLYSVVTAGELLHYQLKSKKGLFGSVGQKYYAIAKEEKTFDGLEMEEVFDIAKADFLYVGQNFRFDATVDHYKQDLSFAVSFNIPLVCAGNNLANFYGGVVGIDSGAFAEQYATLGGSILTVGKPDAKILEYALDGLDIEKERILLIGNNIQVDIKLAALYDIKSVLVTKGLHKHFLGEGYVPDVAKARELANNYNVYPEYLISAVRW